MTLKFNALNIFILILHRILDFYFLEFCVAWNFIIIVVVIISFSGIFFDCNLMLSAFEYVIVLALYKFFIIIIITISY